MAVLFRCARSWAEPAAAVVLLLGAVAAAGCKRPSGDDAVSAACGSETAGSAGTALPTGKVVIYPIGGPAVTVRVEFALTRPTQARGLMCRNQLDPDAGMLFVFPPPPRHQTFWMRNTLIPLDMMFIGEDLRIVGIVEGTEPLTDTPCEVSGDSQYVLEVNGGFSQEHGLVRGARIEIVGLDPGLVPQER